MLVLRITGGVARGGRAARTVFGKTAFLGWDWGEIFYFGGRRGLRARALVGTWALKCPSLEIPVAFSDGPDRWVLELSHTP